MIAIKTVNIVSCLQSIFAPFLTPVQAMSCHVLTSYLTCQTQVVMTGDQCDCYFHMNLGGWKIMDNCIYHYEGKVSYYLNNYCWNEPSYLLGSFSTEPGKLGNGFLFPDYNLKVEFPGDIGQIQLFCFNPAKRVSKV